MKWITREKIKVDRVACPWLIKKFIDTGAEFLFLPRNTDWARINDGIVFDVPNCELGHHGEDVSFNSILKNTISAIQRSFCWARLCAADSHPANPQPAGEGLRWIASGFGGLGRAITKFSNANLSFTMRYMPNANAKPTAEALYIASGGIFVFLSYIFTEG